MTTDDTIGMPLQQWSDGILVVDVGNEPQFSDDMQSLDEAIAQDGPQSLVVNMSGVTNLNSSALGALLRIRRRLLLADRHMRICSVPDNVWGMMMVTGLDKVFDFSPDVSSALASLQLET